jgi:transcriptional regulator with XRE-family HTH domain
MKLAEKLLRIREALELSQNGLIETLELPDTVKQRNVSAWETGYREPNILTLIKYAQAANVCLEILVNDEYDLPKDLPAKKTSHPH